MKTVMTGSSYNIGKPLVKFLVANGHQVIVIKVMRKKNAVTSLGGILKPTIYSNLLREYL